MQNVFSLNEKERLLVFTYWRSFFFGLFFTAPDKSLLLVAISFGNRSRGIGQSLTDDVGNHGRAGHDQRGDLRRSLLGLADGHDHQGDDQ